MVWRSQSTPFSYQCEQAIQDTLTWHHVAQKASEKERENLARAALHKKVAAKKDASKIEEQIKQISDLQLNLEYNRFFVQRQLK